MGGVQVVWGGEGKWGDEGSVTNKFGSISKRPVDILKVVIASV